MPLRISDDRASRAQQRFDRIALIAAIAAGIALGCKFAFKLTTLPSGYIAPYVSLGALVATALLGVIGIVFLPYWRSRRLGVGLMIAGLLTFGTYVAMARVLLKLDRIPWAPPPIHLSAGKQNRVVIFFRRETTESQVSEFVSSKLPFLPDWSDSLYRLAAAGNKGPGLVLNINRGSFHDPREPPAGSRMADQMLEQDVSAFMVKMRRDRQVSSIELQVQP